MQRVLWITGRLPYPLRSGDALYTAGLLRAAHFANLKVTVVGLARLPDTSVDSLNEIAPVEWHPIAAEPSPAWRSIFSTLPKDAYSLFPPGFRDQLALDIQSRTAKHGSGRHHTETKIGSCSITPTFKPC